MSKGSGGIIRVPNYQRFTIIPYNILTDSRLSMKTRGLLVTMLGLPPGWDYSVLGLTKILPDGRRAIGSALQELEEFGYLVREQERGENGKFGNTIYTVIPEPQAQNVTTAEMPINQGFSPQARFPSADKPPAANVQQYNINKYNINNNTGAGRSVGRTTRTREMIQQQINYSDITKSYLDKALIDSIVDIMLDTYKHCKEKITLGNREYDREEVFATLDAITQDEVLSIKEFVSHYTKQIHNPYNFILTLLLQAKEGQDAYWQALVAFDAVGKV